MSKKLHINLVSTDGIHVIQSWDVLDVAARDALPVVAADVGKVARVTSTNAFYLLTGVSPSTWTNMVTGASAVFTSIIAGENLTAGNYVNIKDNGSGGFIAVKANAATGLEAHGFVRSTTNSGLPAPISFYGTNSFVVGQVPGKVYLSAVTPGGSTATPPSTPGQLLQTLGIASSATTVEFMPMSTIVIV